MTGTLHINLLGTPELTLDGAPIVGLRSQKAVALLVYLVCNPRPQRREFLADLLWDSTSTAQSLSNLRTVLTRLRRHLQDYLLATAETVAIAPGAPIRLDVAELEAQMTATGGRISSLTAPQLEQCLSLYRGEFLAGFHIDDAAGFDEWSILERERLSFLVVQGYRRSTDYALLQADFVTGIRMTQGWLRVDPLDETAHAQMMRVLAGSGQLAAALAHYRHCQQLLLSELDVEPGAELQALHQLIKQKTPSASSPNRPGPTAAHNNLPARLTSFVGRTQELAVIHSLFASPTTRLVTLVGEGGVGKSSLALAAGKELQKAWTDGVCLASLAEVTAEPLPTLFHRLANTVAEVIGLTFSTSLGAAETPAQLFSFLSDRSLLLILDNFEQLSAGAPFLAALLQAAPDCRLLVTSREPLLIAAESVVRLAGLPTPPQEAPLPLPDDAYPSITLFLQRARQRQHTFSLSPIDREALGRLCRLLAGNALALELVAPWIEHFSLPEIVQKLETDMLDFVYSPQPDFLERHRSLRQVIQTSWGLLSVHAQQTLAQISIFQGSFHRDAALAITDATLDVLVTLVNCSLLQQRGPGRYELHEMVRQFAAEQLARSADGGARIAERHARYYLALTSRVDQSSTFVDQVTNELANLRQGWEWAVKNAAMDGLAAASIGLWNFYLRKGLFQEAEEAFGRAISAARATPSDNKDRRRALASLQVAQAVFLNIRSRYAEAMLAAEEAIGYAIREEDEVIIARGYLQWGTALYRQGRYADAVTQFRMALVAARDAGLIGDQADVLRHMGISWLEQGNFEEARVCCEEALVLYQRTGNRLGEGNTLNDLGWINQRQQRLLEARDFLQAAHRTHSAIENRHGTNMAAINLGIVHEMLGEFSEAYDTYQQLFRDLDKLPDLYHHSLVNYSLGVLLSRMGDYTVAHRHLMAALEIDRAIGDLGGQAWGHCALGLVYNHLGDYKKALAYHKAALRMGREQNARTIEGLALLGMGQDYFRLDLFDEARAAYEEAVMLQKAQKQTVRIVETQGCLAHTLLALGQPDAAFAMVEQILSYLNTGTLDGAREPAQIYWHCYIVLCSRDDPRAREVLAQAFDLVQKQSARISDKHLRHSYLHAERSSKAIIDEVWALNLDPQWAEKRTRDS